MQAVIVAQTLVEQTGSREPHEELAHAVEGRSLLDIRVAADVNLLDSGKINRARPGALAAAAQFE